MRHIDRHSVSRLQAIGKEYGHPQRPSLESGPFHAQDLGQGRSAICHYAAVYEGRPGVRRDTQIDTLGISTYMRHPPHLIFVLFYRPGKSSCGWKESGNSDTQLD
jgi:hypothetical protein